MVCVSCNENKTILGGGERKSGRGADEREKEGGGAVVSQRNPSHDFQNRNCIVCSLPFTRKLRMVDAIAVPMLSKAEMNVTIYAGHLTLMPFTFC